MNKQHSDCGIGKFACDIERQLAKEEIDEGLQAGALVMRGKTMVPDDKERYHNTKILLKQFRRVLYAVKISEAEMNMRMEMEHGMKMSTLEVNADLAGVDLTGTKMERYAQSVIRSKKMIQIIQHALEIVRNDPDKGEVYYQILYEAYCSPRKPKNREEIFERLEENGFLMAPSTYHLYLRNAIRAFDSVLWGYTARDCMEIIKNFVPEA